MCGIIAGTSPERPAMPPPRGTARSRSGAVVVRFHARVASPAGDTGTSSQRARVFGEPESDGAWAWLTFRAPDGNIYSVGARLGQPAEGM